MTDYRESRLEERSDRIGADSERELRRARGDEEYNKA